MRFAFDVSVKSCGPALLPILRVIFLNAGTVPQETVKLASTWVHHDTDVSPPDHEVSGLGLFHPAKLVGSAVEISRTRIRVREASLLIDRMHQV